MSREELEAAQAVGLDEETLDLIRSVVKAPLQKLTLHGDGETVMSEGSVDGDATNRTANDADAHQAEIDNDDVDEVPVEPLDILGVVVSENDANDLLLQLQPQLRERGVQALVTGRDHADFCFMFQINLEEAHDRFEGQALIAFFPGESFERLLLVRGTNGANYDIFTQDILEQLEYWREKSTFSVLGAGYDWVELKFDKLPDDVETFAQEVYDFCPDILDQGVVKPLPPEWEGKIGTEMTEEETEEIMNWMEETLESQTPADLADYLRREQHLWLWWD
jgi:hypothetical protein